MARDCPKNSNRNFNSNARETTTENKTNDSPPKNTTTPKLTKAQQIRALEEAMEDEERVVYLDARDMRSDFWSAGA